MLRIADIDDAPKIAAHYDALLRKKGLYGLTEPVIPVPEVGSSDTSTGDDEGSDPCAGHVHVSMPLAAADPLTWRLAVELVRRHPEELWILRPLGSPYDLLTVSRLPEVLASPGISFNRSGTHVFMGWFGRPGLEHEEPTDLSWGNGYAADDPREWIRELERAAGLDPVVGPLPPSTRSSLVLRWIAAFLVMQTGSRSRWTAWTEWPEPGIGPGPWSFEAMPQAGEWLRLRGVPEDAALVWFVGTAIEGQRRPELALSVEGHLWRAGAEAIDLFDEYRSARSSLASLIEKTAGDLLP